MQLGRENEARRTNNIGPTQRSAIIIVFARCAAQSVCTSPYYNYYYCCSSSMLPSAMRSLRTAWSGDAGGGPRHARSRAPAMGWFGLVSRLRDGGRDAPARHARESRRSHKVCGLVRFLLFFLFLGITRKRTYYE